jgi:C-terminal processing protease CtpA/Prc
VVISTTGSHRSGQTYDGALVLLIDETNFSTAEQFIVALVDSGRATTVGRLTSGGSGNPIYLPPAR